MSKIKKNKTDDINEKKTFLKIALDLEDSVSVDAANNV